MKVLAIDPGLASTGWALVDGMKYLASGTVTTKPGDGHVLKRAKIIADTIGNCALKVFDSESYAKIVIEYPQVAFGGNAFKGVMENFFVAGYLAGQSDADYLVNPSTWAIGKGRMGERMESARNMAVRAFKVTKLASEHERDALGIALWAVTGGIK